MSDIAQLGYEIDSSDARRATDNLDRMTRSSRKAETATEKMTRESKSLAGTMRGLGTAVAGAAAAFGGFAAARATLREIASFERALIGVGKTTGIAGGELERLGDRVRDISERVPVATDQLLGLAQSAGQLGVKGTDNISRFTETVGKLGIASDLAGEQAATAFARILTVTGTPISEVDRLGSSIVQLGNNFAATESEISGASTRVAQATSQFEVSADEVLGIGTALKAIGVQAEAGGTQIGLAFQEINNAVRQGGEQLQALEEITGRAGQALREDFLGGNTTKVFQEFIRGLNQIQRGGGDVAAELERLDLSGTRAVQVLGTLATRSGVLNRSLRSANEGYRENTALTEEAETASQSLTSQYQLLQNAVSNAFTDVDTDSLVASLKSLRQTITDPQIKQGLSSIAQGIIGISEAAVSAAPAVGRFLQGLSIMLGGTSGNSQTDIAIRMQEIREEIDSLENSFGDVNLKFKPFTDGLDGIGFFDATQKVKGLKEELRNLEQQFAQTYGAASGGQAGRYLGVVDRMNQAANEPAFSAVPSIFRNPTSATNDSGDGSGDPGGGGGPSRAMEMREREILRIRRDIKDTQEALNEQEQKRVDTVEEISQALETEQEAARRIFRTRKSLIEENVEDEERRAMLLRRNEQKLAEDLESIRRQNAGEIQKLFDNTAQNIQRSFGDMFTDVFRDGVDGFKGFADQIKNIFFRLAGEITSLFVTRGLGNILMGATGGQGILGSIGKTLGGGSGGLGGVGELASQVGAGVAEKLGFSGSGGFVQQLGAKLGFQGDIAAQAAQGGPGSVAGGMAPGRFGGSLSSVLGAAGGAFGGYQIGGFVGNELGGGTGGSIGGSIGGALGSVAGPLGVAAGSLGGSVMGSGYDRLLSGDRSLGERITGGIDTIFPGVGSALGSVFGIGDDKIRHPQVALGTRATGSQSFFEDGLSRASPFGQVGLANATSDDASGKLVNDLANTISGVDEQIAKFLTDAQTEAVTKALQERRGFGGVEGSGVRRQIANESGVASLLKDRFGSVFEALGDEMPQTIRDAIEAGTLFSDVDMDPEAIAKAGLAPLQQMLQDRIQGISDEINSVTSNLTSNAQELLQFRQSFGQAGDSIEQQLFRMTGTSNSPLSPTKRLSNARSQFEELLGKAQGGDIDALEQISGSAQNFLGIARQNFGSSPEFFERFNLVQDSLNGLQGVISDQQDRISGVLDNLGVSIERGNQMNNARLDTLIEETRTQNDRLEDLNDRLERLETT